ncbi:MAG: MarR family transcriptional regulator [Gordonia sp. (in: high G+C Gram-positive bacteria)]
MPLHRDLVDEILRITRRRLITHPDAILENSAFNLLWILSDGTPRTLRQLADATHLEQSTVNRQVNAAIKHGYLERFVMQGAVSGLIRPTDKGRSVLEHDALLCVRRLESALSDMAGGTPEVLLAQLHAFNEAYDRAIASETQNRAHRE